MIYKYAPLNISLPFLFVTRPATRNRILTYTLHDANAIHVFLLCIFVFTKRADGIPQVVLTFSLNNKQISHPIVENLYIHVYSTFSLQHILTCGLLTLSKHTRPARAHWAVGWTPEFFGGKKSSNQ